MNVNLQLKHLKRIGRRYAFHFSSGDEPSTGGVTATGTESGKQTARAAQVLYYVLELLGIDLVTGYSKLARDDQHDNYFNVLIQSSMWYVNEAVRAVTQRM